MVCCIENKRVRKRQHLAFQLEIDQKRLFDRSDRDRPFRTACCGLRGRFESIWICRVWADDGPLVLSLSLSPLCTDRNVITCMMGGHTTGYLVGREPDVSYSVLLVYLPLASHSWSMTCLFIICILAATGKVIVNCAKQHIRPFFQPSTYPQQLVYTSTITTVCRWLCIEFHEVPCRSVHKRQSIHIYIYSYISIHVCV